MKNNLFALFVMDYQTPFFLGVFEENKVVEIVKNLMESSYNLDERENVVFEFNSEISKVAYVRNTKFNTIKEEYYWEPIEVNKIFREE